MDREHEKSEREAVFSETIGLIESFHGELNSFLEAFGGSSFADKEASGIPDEVANQYIALTSTDIEMQVFGDTAIVYFPLFELKAGLDRPVMKTKGLLALSASSAVLFRQYLADNRPIRGAIELGWATRLKSGMLYGAILSEVHRLESSVAEWPRIVIGPRYVELISGIARGDHIDVSHLEAVRGVANKLMEYVEVREGAVSELKYFNRFIDSSLSSSDDVIAAQRGSPQAVADVVKSYLQIKSKDKRSKELRYRYGMVKAFIQRHYRPGQPGMNPLYGKIIW